MRDALGQKISAHCRDALRNISLAQRVPWLSLTIFVCKSSPPLNSPPIPPRGFITTDTALLYIHWGLCSRWNHLKLCPPPTDKEQPQKRLLMSSLPDPERAGIRPEKHISYSLSHNQRGLQGEDSKTYLSAFGFGKFGFTLITFSCIHLKHN